MHDTSDADVSESRSAALIRFHADPTPSRGAVWENFDHGSTGHTLAPVSLATAIALGAVLGLALGIVVSVTTDLPLAPEAGLVLGALLAWLSRRDRT